MYKQTVGKKIAPYVGDYGMDELFHLSLNTNSKAPRSDEDDPKDKVRNKLKHYNLMLSYCNPNGEQYQKLKREKETWLKSLHLDENKII